ncbi:TonB-dependent receptor [Acanthopleuribacter pedis]|uniref:TonB-dependent receptor n=1 Tax=Acanthopleuribacter pedis TaxID=442870 RepID=A0A8J7U716_9BACT|nr:TonB-dependent receptor [Acanthopleuribacter pedis]MBO1323342.1 TonB-dependent receptor [Acanthopleuribacter pedis]
MNAFVSPFFSPRTPAILVFTFCLQLGLLWAQSATSGAMSGTVVDADGNPLPGVVLSVTSDALVRGSQTTVTSESGRYRLPSLPPGLYDVRAAMNGFKTAEVTQVRVSLGQIMDVPLTLTPAGADVREQMVVTGETPLVGTTSNATSANLDEQFIERTPLPRDATQLMNYLPGVNDGLAYGGTQSAANAYNLDGVDVSDPASGSQWLLPNVDWIEEVQVLGLGASAEYGGFTGAAVNIVTKSGGNTFSGDVRAYVSNERWNASRADQLESRDLSVSIGGPIIKDRLWFFVSGEEVSRDFTPFQIDEITNAVQAAGLDGADPLLAVDQEEERISRYLAKATWQASDMHKFVLLLDYDGKDSDYRGLSRDVLGSATERQDSPNWSYNLTWEGVLSVTSFVSVKLTGFEGTDDRLPYGGADLPGRTDFETGIAFQNAPYTHLQDKSRTAIKADWTLFADSLFTNNDSHQFKFGITYDDARQDETRTRNGGFTIVDDSFGLGGGDLSLLDQTVAYLAEPDAALFSSDVGNHIRLDSVQETLALFAQDQWRVNRLTFNYGLRYTRYRGGFRNGNESVYEADLIAPRLGFAWDVKGDGTTAVKAHYGRYYEGLFTFLFDRERSGNVFTALEFWDYDFDSGQFEPPSSASVPAAADLDPDIDHPHVDQFLVTVEHGIGRDWLLGVDLVHRETRNIIAMVNANEDYDSLSAIGNPLGADFPFFELLSPERFALTNPAGAYRDYQSVTLRADRRFRDGWSMRGSLVWSDLQGNTFRANSYTDEWEDRNGQTNADGTLPGFAEWEFKLSASVDLPYGVMSSVFFSHRSGAHWTPTVRVRGLLENDRQTVFAAPRGSEQLDDRQLVDLRLAKEFDLGRVRLSLMVDVFNLLDEDTVIEVRDRWGDYRYDFRNHPEDSFFSEAFVSDAQGNRVSRLGSVLERESAREMRLGVKASF